MISRSVSGSATNSSGSTKCNLGKICSVRYGDGGSGEPCTRDVTHGTRSWMAMPVDSRDCTAGADLASHTPSRQEKQTNSKRARKSTGRDFIGLVTELISLPLRPLKQINGK